MNCSENFYIQLYQHKGALTDEHNTGDFNSLYDAVHDVQLKHACA